jgi:hypothetical protein
MKRRESHPISIKCFMQKGALGIQTTADIKIIKQT